MAPTNSSLKQRNIVANLKGLGPRIRREIMRYKKPQGYSDKRRGRQK